MKRLFSLFVLAVVLMVMFQGCSKVPAGYVGVKVFLLGGDKGVDSTELSPGRYWIGWNEELYLFPTFTQNYVWTLGSDVGSPNDESIAFQTIEGMVVSSDIGISYAIDPKKANTIFQKYRRGIDEITDVFLRNAVRDAFNMISSKKAVEYVYGEGKAELLTAVEQMVKEQVTSIGINIERIYIIGNLRLPAQVTEALNRKIQATQQGMQARNELEIAKAEAEKKLVGIRTEVESNRLLGTSITPELMEWRKLALQEQALTKWDGKLPQVTGTGAVPMINLK
jgi:regulator of protease activity HflC (stomatin/prohibitin superfamily)